MPENKPWWLREPLAIVEISNAWGNKDDRDAAMEASLRLKLDPNVEHLHVMYCGGGLDDQHFYFRTSAGRVVMDYLGDYLPHAKAHNRRVIIYFNTHFFRGEFAEQHPDWRQIREDGKPVDNVYSTASAFCINSPGFRGWIFQILKDLCAYPIDGIFYDGVSFNMLGCYCENCKRLYRERFGGELPPKSDRSHPDFHKLVKFQSDCGVAFMRESNQIIKEANPEILFYKNGGLRGANWPTGRFNRELIVHQDVLGTEGGFVYGDLRTTPLWKPGCNAKFIETQAGGKPTVIFNCAGHKSWNQFLLPAAEMKLLYADTIANGAGSWFAVFPDDVDQPEMETIRFMNRLVQDNPDCYRGTRSLAGTAIVWSEENASFYLGSEVQHSDFTMLQKGSEVGNLQEEFEGFYHAMIRSQVPVNVVDEVTLEREELSQYRLLILPNIACMSENAANRLRQWVADGGTLVSSFETSLYDEIGRKRADFLLSDLFGVRYDGGSFGPMDWDHVTWIAETPLRDGITKHHLPAPRFGLKVRADGARSVLNYQHRLKGRYDAILGLSDDPLLLEHSYGKGRSIYFAGTFGGSAGLYRFVEYLRIVKNIAQAVAPSEVVFENLPGSVEVTYRIQPETGARMVHLVNFAGDGPRPFERVIPFENLKGFVRGIENAGSVRTAVLNRPLQWEPADGGIRFTLPKLDEYEMIVIEQHSQTVFPITGGRRTEGESGSHSMEITSQ